MQDSILQTYWISWLQQLIYRRRTQNSGPHTQVFSVGFLSLLIQFSCTSFEIFFINLLESQLQTFIYLSGGQGVMSSLYNHQQSNVSLWHLWKHLVKVVKSDSSSGQPTLKAAPPSGQSWTCICDCNLWPVWLILSIMTPLECLDVV